VQLVLGVALPASVGPKRDLVGGLSFRSAAAEVAVVALAAFGALLASFHHAFALPLVVGLGVSGLADGELYVPTVGLGLTVRYSTVG